MSDTTSLNDLPSGGNMQPPGQMPMQGQQMQGQQQMQPAMPMQGQMQGQPQTQGQMQGQQQMQGSGQNLGGENIILDTPGMYSPNVPAEVSQLGEGSSANSNHMDQKMLNQVVSDIQKASAAGATQLPSRDIPMNQSNITQDQQVKPNFVPSASPSLPNDYITADDMAMHNMRTANKQSSLDTIYDEIQTPILIMMIFFVFQLPVFDSKFKHYFPFLINVDGNHGIGSYLLKSTLFGLLYYIINKIMKHFSDF